jgi:transposase
MIKKMSGPAAMSAGALAKESGICQATLSRWLVVAGTVGRVSTRPTRPTTPGFPDDESVGKRTQDWSASEKVQVVMEVGAIAEEELGAFLRRRGLHREQLEAWRHEVIAAATAGMGEGQPTRGRRSPEHKRIQELERELRRKDKALAETAALLVLKKKVQEIWGDEDDDMDSRSDG